MEVNIKKLDDGIEFYNKYIKGKQFNDEKLQNILSDCLFRYIHFWEYFKKKKREKLIDCIKEFNTLSPEKSDKRLNELKDKLLIPTINETNRLLLIKCIYYEAKHTS